MALNKGIWDPKLKGTNVKGTNLESLRKTAAALSRNERHKEMAVVSRKNCLE